MSGVRSVVVLLLAIAPVINCNLIVYPAANGAPTSNKFQVYLTQDGQQKQSHVYITTSDHRTTEASHVKGGRSMSWTSFAFTGGKVTVEVHTSRDFKNCIVRPKSYGYSCRRSGSKVAVFDVTANTKMMSVEFDYDYGSNTGGPDITDKLMVFADPPETSQPSKTDPSVLYYDVGVHNLNGQVALNNTIKEVYLAPGAFVKGGFKSTATHPVKIHGRGVLDNRDYKWRDSRFSWAAINLDAGNMHILEGITISDPCYYYVRALSNGNTIKNIKMVGAWIYNTNGVSVGANSIVSDCFIHANDDAIKLHAKNVEVTRCVVWQAQNGAVIQTGWWESQTAQNILVSHIDIIHTDWCTFKGSSCHLSENDAVFNNAGDTKSIDISTMVLQDIRVEGTCPRVFYWKMASGASGTMRMIRFVNWSIESQPDQDSLHNEIAGTGSTGHVSDLQFVNFRIGGHCASTAAAADFILDTRTTSSITFSCGSDPVG